MAWLYGYGAGLCHGSVGFVGDLWGCMGFYGVVIGLWCGCSSRCVEFVGDLCCHYGIVGLYGVVQIPRQCRSVTETEKEKKNIYILLKSYIHLTNK